MQRAEYLKPGFEHEALTQLYEPGPSYLASIHLTYFVSECPPSEVRFK